MSLKHQVFKSSTIKEYGTDRYGRILGLAFADGTNVNLEEDFTVTCSRYLYEVSQAVHHQVFTL